MFPDELPGLPPEREVQFEIDVMPSVDPETPLCSVVRFTVPVTSVVRTARM